MLLEEIRVCGGNPHTNAKNMQTLDHIWTQTLLLWGNHCTTMQPWSRIILTSVFHQYTYSIVYWCDIIQSCWLYCNLIFTFMCYILTLISIHCKYHTYPFALWDQYLGTQSLFKMCFCKSRCIDVWQSWNAHETQWKSRLQCTNPAMDEWTVLQVCTADELWHKLEILSSLSQVASN